MISRIIFALAALTLLVSQASGQGMLLGAGDITRGGGGGGPTLTYRSTTVDETSSATITFSSVSIGAASSDRLVVAAVGTGGGGSDITAVTIGGVSATIHASGSAGTWQNAAIASATITTGTTADIVVSKSSATHPTVLGVYTITGLNSTTPASTSANNGDPINLSLNVPADGVLVTVGHGGDADAAYTVTGATADASGVDSFVNYWLGSATGLSANATYPIQFSRGNGWSAAAAAVWR